ncbi:putative Choline-phosphate cytidylyltransferase B-like 2, partial [Homarus americanus]
RPLMFTQGQRPLAQLTRASRKVVMASATPVSSNGQGVDQHEMSGISRKRSHAETLMPAVEEKNLTPFTPLKKPTKGGKTSSGRMKRSHQQAFAALPRLGEREKLDISCESLAKLEKDMVSIPIHCTSPANQPFPHLMLPVHETSSPAKASDTTHVVFTL